ncbi:MAG TPA: orotidine-5'-phosphate decarboxylase [Casimicrobiaceae bacterium]|nr:orotidine-5'-phosphate decarboxylase [Casimicrobiaceae bacterium]
MTATQTSHVPRIIVALDYADAAPARAMLDRLDPKACSVKVGKELFTGAGPELVRDCVARGFRVFLDLKYHDIPNTVGHACAAATRLGVWMLNVHAAGGAAMLAAARQGVDRAAAEQSRPAPLLIAVTVLTSLDDAGLASVGVGEGAEANAMRLARVAHENRLDGVVCSARDAAALRAAFGSSFKLVTPGIRLADTADDDQARIATPTNARSAGADYLVIGRPITQAPDPLATLAAIRESIEDAA